MALIYATGSLCSKAVPLYDKGLADSRAIETAGGAKGPMRCICDAFDAIMLTLGVMGRSGSGAYLTREAGFTGDEAPRIGRACRRFPRKAEPVAGIGGAARPKAGAGRILSRTGGGHQPSPVEQRTAPAGGVPHVEAD